MSNAGKGKGRRYRQQKVYGTNIRSVKGKKEIAHWKTVLLLDFPNNCLIYLYYGLVEFFTEMLNLASSIQPNFIWYTLQRGVGALTALEGALSALSAL